MRWRTRDAGMCTGEKKLAEDEVATTSECADELLLDARAELNSPTAEVEIQETIAGLFFFFFFFFSSLTSLPPCRPRRFRPKDDDEMLWGRSPVHDHGVIVIGWLGSS
jgi:hypothetical protein